MEAKLTLSDKATPVLQLAMDTENKRRDDSDGPDLPFTTMDEFLSWVVAKYFGVTDAELEAKAKADALAVLQEPVDKMTVAEITALAATAADIVKGKGGSEILPNPVEPVKEGNP